MAHPLMVKGGSNEPSAVYKGACVADPPLSFPHPPHWRGVLGVVGPTPLVEVVVSIHSFGFRRVCGLNQVRSNLVF
jgi:hypothetical protein